jgi:hypothetical protein
LAANDLGLAEGTAKKPQHSWDLTIFSSPEWWEHNEEQRRRSNTTALGGYVVCPTRLVSITQLYNFNRVYSVTGRAGGKIHIRPWQIWLFPTRTMDGIRTIEPTKETARIRKEWAFKFTQSPQHHTSFTAVNATELVNVAKPAVDVEPAETPIPVKPPPIDTKMVYHYRSEGKSYYTKEPPDLFSSQLEQKLFGLNTPSTEISKPTKRDRDALIRDSNTGTVSGGSHPSLSDIFGIPFIFGYVGIYSSWI